MLNLSSLFFTVTDESCMHGNLDLTPEQRTFIASVRTEVRNCLRTGIPYVLRENGYTEDVPQPRFFTQGSWAYKTLNVPAHLPPQQADVDDGCYLPLSFVSQERRPSIAAKVFFAAAEASLKPLVAVKRWKLVTDKPTCIRIVISVNAHIDIPLYAIPDQEFIQLTEKSRRYGYKSLTEALSFAAQDTWTMLPPDKVLLAHREYDWISSDPRPIKDWFLSEVAAKGEQLRRVVRYLKAFRDWRWTSGGPASILLMAAATPLFEKRNRRDDLALLHIVTALPAQLRAGVNNPVEASESLTERLGEAGVEEAAKAFEEFEEMLRGAIHASDPPQACTWMQQEFGPRFPNEPNRINVVSVADTIIAAPVTTGPSELIGRTKAG